MKYLISLFVACVLMCVPVSSKQMYKVYIVNGGRVMLEEESFSPPSVLKDRVEINGKTFIGFAISWSASEIPWK